MTRSATVSALASFRRMKRAGLAATIKARWICEQAHQQLKEKLGLDHFEGRSWQGLHRHALMTMIAYAFLQHRHLTQVGRKKESTDRRLSLACRPYATPSSISFFDHYLSNAHTAEDEAVKNSGVGKSAKVVLGRVLINRCATVCVKGELPYSLDQHGCCCDSGLDSGFNRRNSRSRRAWPTWLGKDRNRGAIVFISREMLRGGVSTL